METLFDVRTVGDVLAVGVWMATAGEAGGVDQRTVGLLGCVELVDGGRVELLVGVPPLRCWSRP